MFLPTFGFEGFANCVLCHCLCLCICIWGFCQLCVCGYVSFIVFVFVFASVFEGFANCVCGYGQQQPGDVLLSFVFNASTAGSSQPLQTYRNISTRVEIQNVKKEIPVRAHREIQNVKKVAWLLKREYQGVWGGMHDPRPLVLGMPGWLSNKCPRLSDQEPSQFSYSPSSIAEPIFKSSLFVFPTFLKSPFYYCPFAMHIFDHIMSLQKKWNGER